jgi:hypothetical protein
MEADKAGGAGNQNFHKKTLQILLLQGCTVTNGDKA